LIFVIRTTRDPLITMVYWPKTYDSTGRLRTGAASKRTRWLRASEADASPSPDHHYEKFAIYPARVIPCSCRSTCGRQ
jgi:hypothetical protein